MSYNETSSSLTLGNPSGKQKYTGRKGMLKYLMFAPKGTEIATKVAALTQTTWTNNQNAAIADRWLLLPAVFDATPNQEETKREESEYGNTAFVRAGKLLNTVRLFEVSVYDKTQIMLLNNGSFDVFEITDLDKICGYTSDGVKFKPYSLDYHRVNPESEDTGSVNGRISVELKYSDVRQRNDMQAVLEPVTDTDAPTNWYPTIELPIAAIKDVKITVVSMTAVGAVIDIKGYDGEGYDSAVKEDLYLRKSTIDGVAISITSLTLSATISGRYTVVFGSQTSGTFYYSLYPQGAGAVTQGVETPENTSHAFSVS